jgi:uncharacterized protein YgbK (DUF1537 family)
MALIGAIADDLTGATTVGALLAKSGVDTVVLFNTEYIGSGEAVCRHQAVLVSTDSRALPREEAYGRVKAAAIKLREIGVKQFSKRIDTTLRGGIGTEIDAMLDALGDDYVAVMVPAMPQSNRILIGGYSLIDGVPLSKTPVANDVKTPVMESFVPRLIASQTKNKIAYIGLDELLHGKENLKKILSESRKSGARILLVDATSLNEVEMIAQAVTELKWQTIAVDPGPFTERLAAAHGWADPGAGNSRKIRTESDSGDKGTVMVVAGSATPVTTMQMRALRRLNGTHVIPVKILPLLSGKKECEAEINSVAEKAEKLFASDKPPRALILAFETTLTGKLVDLIEQESLHGLAAGQASGIIAESLGKIARGVMKRIAGHVIGIYLTGGDIMVSVCRNLDVKGIKLIDYVIPQADQGRLVGGICDGLSVVCKGGLTGEEKTAVQCVNRLFDERKYNPCNR